MDSVIRPLDHESLRDQFDNAYPFRFFVIDGFLDSDFALEAASAYPTYEKARAVGFEFQAVNERSKIQITDPQTFPRVLRELGRALNGDAFLKDLERITSIPRLVGDETYAGGGMHMTGPRGRLDVHIDFNYLRDRALHRRLNILLYLNAGWRKDWGGNLELWDSNVEHASHSIEPVLNRCVVFETSDISYHGVAPVACPPDQIRKSFAAYYYTREAPAKWDGTEHSTVFRARPNEWLRRTVLMPMERWERSISARYRESKQRLKASMGSRRSK